LVLAVSGVTVVDGDFSCTPVGDPVGLVSLSVIELLGRADVVFTDTLVLTFLLLKN